MKASTTKHVLWIVGLLLLVAATGVLATGQVLSGSLYALAGALLIPPVWDRLQAHSPRPIGDRVRWVAVIIPALVASSKMAAYDEAIARRPVDVVSRSSEPLLCRSRESFGHILGARSALNQELERTYRNQPELWARMTTTKTYLQREMDAMRAVQDRLVAQGECMVPDTGAHFKAANADLAGDDPKRWLDVIAVTYQGQPLWSWAGDLHELVDEHDNTPAK